VKRLLAPAVLGGALALGPFATYCVPPGSCPGHTPVLNGVSGTNYVITFSKSFEICEGTPMTGVRVNCPTPWGSEWHDGQVLNVNSYSQEDQVRVATCYPYQPLAGTPIERAS
jgi:hypothetical protein